MCLSLRTSGGSGVSIHGPANCSDFYDAIKSFNTLYEFDVDWKTNDSHVHEDNTVKVEHVKLSSASKKKFYAPKPIYTSWYPGKNECEH